MTEQNKVIANEFRRDAEEGIARYLADNPNGSTTDLQEVAMWARLFVERQAVELESTDDNWAKCVMLSKQQGTGKSTLVKHMLSMYADESFAGKDTDNNSAPSLTERA